MTIVELIQIIFVVAGTFLLFLVSYKSLKDLKAHGFYRFFVFESILILILINIPFWFRNPFSLRQIFSWFFLVISIYLVYQSYNYLKNIGGSNKRKDADANYNFENTVNLITSGIYKYIRHPMYASLLFLGLGALLKNISSATVILFCISIIFLFLTAKVEEKENIRFFGDDYLNYIKRTKMFIPFLF